MVNVLKQFYMRQQFLPNFWGLFLNPFYFARKGLAQEISRAAQHIQGKTLDIGCGLKPYEGLCHSSQYSGLEIDNEWNRKNKKADYFYDGNHFPFNDEEFDSVISSQTFEHIFNPDSFLDEVHRVMKKEGVFLLTLPFVWDEHEQPYDFARYSSFGIMHLLAKHGFQVIFHKKTMNDVRVIFQVINMYLYKKLVPKNIYIEVLLVFFFITPFNILGELLALVTPKNNDLYLDNIILVKKEEIKL